MWDTMQTLQNTLWRYPALVPAMPHLGGKAPSAPRNIIIDGAVIHWENTELSADPLVKPHYFVIYRGENEWIDINDPGNIITIVPANNGQIHYTWILDDDMGNYRYAITAVNRLHDESRGSLSMPPDL